MPNHEYLSLRFTLFGGCDQLWHVRTGSSSHLVHYILSFTWISGLEEGRGEFQHVSGRDAVNTYDNTRLYRSDNTQLGNHGDLCRVQCRNPWTTDYLYRPHWSKTKTLSVSVTISFPELIHTLSKVPRLPPSYRVPPVHEALLWMLTACRGSETAQFEWRI